MRQHVGEVPQKPEREGDNGGGDQATKKEKEPSLSDTKDACLWDERSILRGPRDIGSGCVEARVPENLRDVIRVDGCKAFRALFLLRLCGSPLSSKLH
ncbi:hypothetical protein MTO96_047787 [Rhipicephalus appendiculatus]